jgi:anti-anti-sigma factor
MTGFQTMRTGTPDNYQHLECRYEADCDGARICVYVRGLATVLRIEGDIDAANAERVAAEIRRFSRLQTPLILDLSHLDFLGLDGFRLLLRLNQENHQARLHCSLVPGPAMRLLTHIVKDHGLPLAGSVPEALQLIEDAIGARREFLPGLARTRESQRTAPAVGTAARP